MKLINSLLSLLLLLTVTAFGADSKQKWSDTVKVGVIWNSGTGDDDLPGGWNPENGEIGAISRDYVLRAIGAIKSENIKVFTGTDSNWPQIADPSNDAGNLKSEFGGRLPDVIVYINAGYEWDQVIKKSNRSTAPYKLLRRASDLGVGIVCVGDDAAEDAQSIFTLTGYEGVGKPIQYHESQETGGLQAPYMEDGSSQSGFTDLKIVLDPTENRKLPDRGLLYNVPNTELHFKPWERNGRGQADADVWDVDISKTPLDNFATVGFQTAKLNGAPCPNPLYPRLYKAIGALQYKINRVVMLGYQPQYLEDEKASMQIIYNSLFWASKAKEMMKIGTPLASPDQGSPNNLSPISLKVEFPLNSSLYKIKYEINDEGWKEYTGSFTLPNNGRTVTVKTFAEPTSSTGNYTRSNDTSYVYEFKGGPVLESARLTPGAINSENLTREDDTLVVTFSDEMKDFNTDKPFLSKDRDGDSYTYTLSKRSKDGKTYKFVVTNCSKSKSYLPADGKDSIQIDKNAKLSNINGAVQDGALNHFIPLWVDGVKIPQISTPEISPNSGNTQNVKDIRISVARPSNSKFYKLRYSFDGIVSSSSSEVPSGNMIQLPTDKKSDITLTVQAFTTNPDSCRTSEIATATYKYIAPPVIDSAVYFPGSIKDFSNTTMNPDTLKVYFDQDVESISSERPFLSKDKNGKDYKFVLIDQDDQGKVHTYIISTVEGDGKNKEYRPENQKDLITIDPSANVKASNGLIQNGENNRTVRLIVKPAPSNVKLSTIWYDESKPEMSALKNVLQKEGFAATSGVLVLVDPQARLLDSEWDLYDGSMIVLDALGHKVLSLKSLRSNTESAQSKAIVLGNRSQFAIFWNANNEQGRRVGSSAYLAVITITDATGKKTQLHTTLPVRGVKPGTTTEK